VIESVQFLERAEGQAKRAAQQHQGGQQPAQRPQPGQGALYGTGFQSQEDDFDDDIPF